MMPWRRWPEESLHQWPGGGPARSWLRGRHRPAWLISCEQFELFLEYSWSKLAAQRYRIVRIRVRTISIHRPNQLQGAVLTRKKNSKCLGPSFSRPHILHAAFSFIKDWNFGLILLGLRWIVLARSVARHPLSTFLLAHFTLTSMELSVAGSTTCRRCIHSIVSGIAPKPILTGIWDFSHRRQHY